MKCPCFATSLPKSKYELNSFFVWLYRSFIFMQLCLKIDALRNFFKSKKANLDNSISADDIFDHLNDLIKNLDSIYHSVSDENDLEVVLNSLISLVIISTNEKLSKLVTTLCESIVKAPLAEKFGIVKLRTSVFFLIRILSRHL